MWQTPFQFAGYGIQSTRGNGSGWHRRFSSQASVRSPVSLLTEQHGKVLGRRKIFSIRAFSHKFRICGAGRSPLSQEQMGQVGSICACNRSQPLTLPGEKALSVGHPHRRYFGVCNGHLFGWALARCYFLTGLSARPGSEKSSRKLLRRACFAQIGALFTQIDLRSNSLKTPISTLKSEALGRASAPFASRIP